MARFFARRLIAVAYDHAHGSPGGGHDPPRHSALRPLRFWLYSPTVSRGKVGHLMTVSRHGRVPRPRLPLQRHRRIYYDMRNVMYDDLYDLGRYGLGGFGAGEFGFGIDRRGFASVSERARNAKAAVRISRYLIKRRLTIIYRLKTSSSSISRWWTPATAK